MKKRSVCIIGGGASGMIAALFAAKEGAAVTILEHNDKVGKKLLATGNGRCNLTNMYQAPSCYHSSEQERAWKILQQFDVQQTIRFFSDLGLYTRNKNGGIYPFSMQAQSVRDVLELEARQEKIKIKCKEHVKEIIPSLKEDFPVFQIVTETWTYEADAVILACGSRASLVEGADGSGYDLAKKLGLSMRKPLPALVPLRGKGTYFSKWAGIRTEGKISLFAAGRLVDEAAGELQLTEYGISGIPVFQVSSQAVRLLEEGISLTAILDFMPDFEEQALLEFLKGRQQARSYKNQKELLLGIFPKKLVDVLTEGKPDMETLAGRIKRFPVKIKGSKAMEAAQVCSGGVLLKNIRPKTMECVELSGLYLAGEILDVDGICGGYNLQWAWTTGALAGVHAARGKEKRSCLEFNN